MDGVLFDSVPFAKEFFLKGHPGMTSKMFKDMHTGNFYEGTNKYLHLRRPETEEEKEKRHIEYTEKKNLSPMFKGVKEFLKELHRTGFILVLNTNAYDRNCLPLLEKAKIKTLFDFWATAEVSESKIEKFRLIEEKYNVKKKDLLFITDTLGDVKEANIAGISTIAVTWGVHDRSFFEKEKYNNLIGIVDTIKELEDFIKNNY